MILTSDVAEILFHDCQAFGIEVFRKGNIPVGELKKERITIHPKQQTPSQYWLKDFVEVNLCVPDVRGKANLRRLKELERQAKLLLDDIAGEYDNSHYLYTISSIGVEEDTAMKCSYVNVRILFEVLNVK